jgi:hypothetical protein
MILVFGYKTPNRREVPEVLYVGSDGDEAQKAIDKGASTFPRIGRMDQPEPFIRMVQHFDPDHPAVEKAEPAEIKQLIDELPEERPSYEESPKKHSKKK